MSWDFFYGWMFACSLRLAIDLVDCHRANKQRELMRRVMGLR